MRKIVLTNKTAETSLTISDVVDVVSCGKLRAQADGNICELKLYHQLCTISVLDTNLSKALLTKRGLHRRGMHR